MSPSEVAEIRDRLTVCGQRTTIARITLLYLLERSPSPKKAAELFAEAGITVNGRSTITRVLRDLEKFGFCRRIKTNDGPLYVATMKQSTPRDEPQGTLSQEPS
jgi:Fe2+ or Zn2+ uptake regulation protein